MKRLLIGSFLIILGMFIATGCTKNVFFQASFLHMSNDTTTDIVHSKKIGNYKITIYYPNTLRPANGWPILYLLDGDSVFAQAVATVKRQNHQAIIVAIDYPDKTRRELDYLPHPPELTLEILSNGKINIPDAYGGADNFLAFMQNELKPALAQRFEIDPSKQIVFGHSIGGLWVLHTLFTQPITFNYYIASSPSIWFSDRYILQEAVQFIKQYQKTELTKPIDLSISVGEFEQSLSGRELFSSDNQRQLRLQHLQNRRMVDNIQELEGLLTKANVAKLSLYYQIYLNQTHQTVAVEVLNDRIAYLLHSFSEEYQ
ncbi:alpha/beta hydrolase-fold protein [Orbus sturtevantii]|uniref:alpha/beta hydrolase n=1 Tax=Orbus sturtevantii TaxID=3074109 RepID=UPI00370D84FE